MLGNALSLSMLRLVQRRQQPQRLQIKAKAKVTREKEREIRAKERAKGIRVREKANQVGSPITRNGRASTQGTGFNKVSGKSGHRITIARVMAKVLVKALAKREL